MDMIDGPVDGFDDLDGAAHVPIFVFELGSLGRAKCQLGGEAGPGVDGDTCLLEAGTDLVKLPVVEELLMDEQGLHSVASAWVVSLGVEDNPHGFVEVGVFVKVHMADALGVAQHGNQLGLLLD